MFTGIVEELGTVEAVEDQGDAVRLTVARHHRARGRRPRRLDRGQRLLPDRGSTLDDGRRRPWTADVMEETLDKTGLGGARARRPGQPRARGHRRQAARRPHRPGPRRRRRHDRPPRRPASTGRSSRSRCRPTSRRYLVDKGSITVDGVSLTVVEAGRRTSLHRQPDPRDAWPAPRSASGQPGDPVNLEVDVIAKYVERRQLDLDRRSTRAGSAHELRCSRSTTPT